MPLLSVDARNASLDGDYGTTRGPHAADSHELALVTVDPSIVADPLANEVTGGGYERPLVAPTDWTAAVGGAKATTLPVQFADATDTWSGEAKWWVLVDADDHTTCWDSGALNVPLNVVAGPGPAVQITVFYVDDLVA